MCYEKKLRAWGPALDAREYFDGVAAGYEEAFGDDSVWSIAHRIGIDILNENCSRRPNNVVDVGCGTGKWGRIFAKLGCNVTFADISENMVREAIYLASQEAGDGNLDGQCLSVDDMRGIETSRYDLTLCMGDPLSYCDSYTNGILELVRITKPGGIIFTSVDSRLGYLRIFKEKYGYDLGKLSRYLEDGNVVGWEGLPIHTFTHQELSQVFASAGASTIGVWGLPIVSSYFLFDPAFQEALKKPEFMKGITEIERKLYNTSEPVGTHHLYGLFRKIPGHVAI